MYNFIVLGMVPGTNFQITWQTWLNVAGIWFIMISIRFIYRNRHTIELAFQPVRQSVPASQLHSRLQY